MPSINELAVQIFANANDKGFWDIDWKSEGNGLAPSDLLVGTKLALISSEAAEALEEFRANGNTEAFSEELADISIRVFDLAAYFHIDLDTAISRKIEKNKGRSIRHGKRF